MMGSEAKVIVKLISPCEMGVRCEEHKKRIARVSYSGKRCRPGMKGPPTASVGLALAFRNGEQHPDVLSKGAQE
jgi:hypothetical protein